MIKKIDNTPRYGKYFLSMEAPEDLANDPNIKPNTKIITIKPSNRRSKLFKLGDDYMDTPVINDNIDTDGMDLTDDLSADTLPEPSVTIDGNNVEDSDDENSPIIDTDPIVQQIADDNAELNIDNDTDEQPTDDLDTSTEINTDEPMDDTTNIDPNTGEEIPPEEGQPVDGEVPPEGAPVDGQAPAKRGPGIEYDSTRKYVLFQKYVELCSAIQDYIEKFDSMTNDDYNTNQVYKTASKKLNEVYEVTYDYITMRYEISTYVQSLLFYQERIACIYKIFDMVKSSMDTLNKKKKK